jgi:4-carboxymuconolactone decarboxylase
MTRYSTLSPDSMTEAQRRVREEVLAGKRGRMVPPIEVWLRSPGLAARAQSLGEYCRFESALPPRLAELAILVSARRWAAQFEWWAHARLAREAGIADATIEAIRTRRTPDLTDAESRIVYRFATRCWTGGGPTTRSSRKRGRLWASAASSTSSAFSVTTRWCR